VTVSVNVIFLVEIVEVDNQVPVEKKKKKKDEEDKNY